LVALALAASLASLLEGRRRREGRLDVDALVLVGATWLAALGAAATVLAWLGIFGPETMSAVSGLGALIAWPWGRPRPSPRPRSIAPFALGLLLVIVGLALRWPLADYPLAGRDQGTYTLRAQHTLREGRLDAVDPVLAQITETRSRPGPADLRGLYSRRGEPWRRDLYEAAYRPGFYLSDLDRGRIRPQFLHMHPMLMATAGLVFGPEHVIAIVPLWSSLALLGLWAVARRLWPRGGWSWLAITLWICAPLVIWVQRTALSEGPSTLLMIAALLAVLRARDGDHAALGTAALLLGANAWVRGNGWLAVPVILAAQWLVPSQEPRARRAGLIYAAAFAAAVLVHAPTTFPYLHDELLRQLPLKVHLTPTLLITASAAGIAAWFALDELGPLRRREARWLAIVHRLAPRVLAAGLVFGLGLYLALRVEPLARPFSRLDPIAPLVGIPALVLAALGLARVVRRWPTAPTGANAWLLGLAGVLVATVLLYAQRNLPQLGLYYYGRYLVTELYPAVLLLAVEGLRAIHARLLGRTPSARRIRLASAAAILGGLGLLGSTAKVLVLHPITRLQEFAGASRVVDHLASRIPEGSIVIAGGEGWHSGHTFNQVGGALAFGHGITVLPYRNREAAYATLHELLIARPRAGGPEPAVFLLLNEATKHHTRDPEDPAARIRIAALDDLLPPPFVARRIDLVEMLLQRLTPTHEGPPIRVTRDGLRMALMQVEVDPEREAEIERWDLSARQSTWVVDGPPGLTIEGGAPRDEHPCLGKAALEITLPEAGGAGSGPVSLVLIAAPGTAARNARWSLEIDGEPAILDAPRVTSRHRDTLGPFTLTHRPKTIVIHGAKHKVRHARCPRGGLVELRLLGPEAPMLRTAETHAITFAPDLSLGHPVTPVAWVSGRGLSRHRPGLTPTPEVRGLSLVIETGPALHFSPIALPDGGREPVELVVTLTASQLGPAARLLVFVDGEALPPIDPPDQRAGSWQSPALRLSPSSSSASIAVQLRDAAESEHVMLRDIGLFSRASPLPGHLADE